MRRSRPVAAPSIAGAVKLLAALVGLTGMAVFFGSAILAARPFEARLREDQLRLADATIAAVELAAGEPLQVVRPIAQLAEALGFESPGLRLAMRAATAKATLIESLRFVESSGRVALAEPEGAVIEGADLSGSALFLAARAGKSSWSPIYAGLEDGRREISLALPAGDGVLLAAIDFEALAESIAGVIGTGHIDLSVVDSGGTFLVHADPGRVERREVNFGFVEQRLAAPEAESFDYAETEGAERKVWQVRARRIAVTGWYVLVRREAGYISDTIRDAALGGALIALVFTLAALAMAANISRKLLEDVDRADSEAVRALEADEAFRAEALRFRETRQLLEVVAAAIGRWKESLAARGRLEELNRRLEAALEELGLAQRALVEREKLATLGDIAANLAHEINSPLGAVVSGAGGLDAELRRALSALPELAGQNSRDSLQALADLVAAVPDRPVYLGSAERRRFAAPAAAALGGGEEAEELAEGLVEALGREPPPELLRLLSSAAPATARIGLGLAEALLLSRVVCESGERAARVIAALRGYLREEAAECPLPVELGSTIETALDLLRLRLVGVELSLELGPPRLVLAVPDRLVQIWTNLIVNAGQAIGWRGKIAIRLSRAGESLLAEIEDDGPGIAPEVRDHLFEPFVTTKPRGEGTGLGLPLVKRLVESFGGEVTWESCPGRTIFRIRLPLAPPARSAFT